MRILHLSDLHLGIKLYEYSLMEEQKFFLDEILKLVKDEGIGMVILAGDIYDKGTPAVEAVKLFDDFLYGLSNAGSEIFIISGNHDSASRLSFAGRLLEKGGIHISPVFDGSVKRIDSGNLSIYLLPFIRPSAVRRYLEVDVNSYDEAIKAVLERTAIDAARVNILVAHQFVAGGSVCESDDVTVGGIENVRTDAFDKFDYVALGHLHNPQSVGRKSIRYAGSPMKYSLSEENVKKSVTIIDVDPDGKIDISERYIKPLRDIKKIEGSYEEIMAKGFYENLSTDDYFYVVLTDTDRIYDAMNRLRTVYPNILSLRYKNSSYNEADYPAQSGTEDMSPLEIVKGFFVSQNGYAMSESQEEILVRELTAVWEADNEAD